MSGVALSSPHSWALRLVLGLALPALACSPQQAVDRSAGAIDVGVGGAMRSGNPPAGQTGITPPSGTTSPSDPAKIPTSIDPVPPGSTAGADAGTPGDPTPATPESDAAVTPPPASDDAGMPATIPSSPTTPPPAAADAGTPDNAPEPGLSNTVAASCKDLPEWVPDSGPYLGGEKVTYGTPKHKFECRPWPFAPWCAQLEYEPGKAGIEWTDAWIDRGLCP
jgi:hypothetical protein